MFLTLKFLRKNQNGRDIPDGVEVDFLGFLTMNPVASNGFSNLARF
jgi:hypothetical protein